MTAQEMVIEVNTSLQAIGASRTRKFYDQEIEWYLNKMIVRFIQDKVRRKENDQNLFEIDELYKDALRNLIVETSPILNYSPDGLMVQGYLPPDYSYLLGVGAAVTKCINFLPGMLMDQGYEIIGVAYPPDSTAGNQHYFENINVKLNGNSIYSRSGYYSYAAGFQLIEEVTSNTPISQDVIGPFRKQGYMLILVPALSSGNNVFTIDYEGATKLTSTVLSTITTKKPIITGLSINTPVRTVRNTNTYSSSTTPYYRTSDKEITMNTIGSVMFLDTAKNFIVNNLGISYVRKPRRISVSLNIGSDIAPDYHPEICDMTVNHIRERIGDPKYQTGLIDSKQS